METLAGFEPDHCGIAALIHQGERESGDRCVLRQFDSGALVAVMDALGHGPEAAQAAYVAAAILESNATETPIQLVRRCHANLQRERGVVLGIASFDWRRRTMTWLGIGNVAGVLLRADKQSPVRIKRLLVRGGVVGHRLPELQAEMHEVFAGDMLVLATDGIRAHFSERLPLELEPQQLADQILHDYATHSDDAMVLVFRCTGDLL